MRQKLASGAILALALSLAAPVLADGRLAWTGGVTQIEGAGGGGLVPWALTAGLGTAEETGASAFLTRVATARFTLTAAGAAVGWHDRVEVSYARQSLDAGEVIPGVTLRQDVLGLKLHLAGDAVADQDRWQPQLAVGALWKHNRDFDGVPAALGARHADAIDLYVAATKVYLGAIAGRNALLNVTLIRSSANQLGLLGAGGERDAEWRPAASAAVWLSDAWLLGAEYRAKRGALSAPAEGDAHDVFIAYGPSKHLNVVLAYADLGPVAGQGLERGPYLSLNAVF
ncbi:MAG: DUF3034 family protein [Proteobacteria bacterium]|nr:DUF3034 family protein [Pseudomonadota bacterium]